jgi:hypothetical protein
LDKAEVAQSRPEFQSLTSPVEKENEEFSDQRWGFPASIPSNQSKDKFKAKSVQRFGSKVCWVT